MIVNIKLLHETAVMPVKAHPGDAGLDLTATSRSFTKDYIEYGTSLAMEIPDGYVGFIYPRSSISKMNLSLCNSVGVVDSKFRGEVMVRFDKRDHDLEGGWYNVGDRVAQLIIMPYPEVTFNQVDELDDTVRGIGGFGSSGIKELDLNSNIAPISRYNLSEL